MSAAILRRAASLMRERAEVLSFCAPWSAIPARDGLPAGVVGGQRVIADLDERTDAAVHIASWHPAVALAVADWLDAEAESHRADVVGPYPSGCCRMSQALAVARTYLGSAS